MTEEGPPRKIIEALRATYTVFTFEAHYSIRDKEIAEYY